jgi:hypothetical protein
MGLQEFISSVCVQTAVYWAPGTRDGFGQPARTTGVEIACRWDDTTELIINRQGKEVASRAKVLITQDLNVEGYLYLGILSSLSTEQKTNPKLVSTAYPIQKIDKNPEFKSTSKFVRTVYL